MRKLIATFCLCTMTSGVFAQGLINFFNNANTLVGIGTFTNGGFVNSGPITGSVGSYYFGLLTSPVGQSLFTFTGLYGTNQTVAGRFTGGANVQVPGWAPGTSRDFEVAGWSASLGPTFNPQWLTTPPLDGGLFGVSALATGQAGGFNGTGTLPNLNIFGGTSGIQSGFLLLGPVLVPEPSSMALTVAGVVVLLIFAIRPKTAPPPSISRG